MNDDAKRVIHARRARFVAVAMATLGTGCPGPSAPQPCLSQPAPEIDGGAAPAPESPEVAK